MIERRTDGGTCVNIGCVPSKTLLRAGEINHLAINNPFIGLQTTAQNVDLASLVKQKNELVNTLRNEKYVNLIDDYGFELINGEAKFINENTVEVNGNRITAKRFLIATGASPSVPTIPGLGEVEYLTSTTLLELKRVPKRLIVLGSGYIGLELGQLFHNLGAEVTLIQRSERLLEEYDPEISEAIIHALTEQGINLVTDKTHFEMMVRILLIRFLNNVQYATCHGGNLEGRGNAPALANIGSELSESEIHDIIQNGKNGMPLGLIKEEELDAVAKWLSEKK